MATSKIRTGQVTYSGLKEVDRALKELGPDIRAELKQVNREVAATEAAHVQSAAQGLGGVSAKAAGSIGVVGSFQSAGVAFGGAAYPYAAGAAFGGQGRSTTMQFAPWVRGGYWPFPQIADDSSDITEKYVDAVNKVISRNFPG